MMLILFGVSFRTAPVAVRKTLMFDTEEIADLLRRARAELPGPLRRLLHELVTELRDLETSAA